MSERPIGLLRLAAFASPIAPVTVAFLPLVLLIPGFYAQDLGLNVATVGGALLFARLFDAVSDPLVGLLSDRTSSRFGRRRPWLVAGTPVLGFAVLQLFVPSESPSTWQLYAMVLLVYAGWTMIFIPHQAWGAELQRSYAGRARVNVAMGLANNVGVLSCLVIPFIFLSPYGSTLKDALFGWLLDGSVDLPSGLASILDASASGRVPFGAILQLLAWLIAILLPLSVLLCIVAVPDPGGGTATVDWRRAPGLFRRNRPFARMIVGGFFVQISVQMWTAAQPFYLSAVLELPDAFLLLLVVNASFALVTVPVWGWIGRTLGRGRALALAGLLMIAGMVLLFVIPAAQLLWALPAYLCLGAASDGKWMMPIALAADTADYDEWKNGTQEAGLHLAVLFLANKMGIAMGGLTLILLGVFGFQPGDPENTESALQALRYIATVVPMICSAIGVVVLWNFRITPRSHEAIRRRLERRRTALARAATEGVTPS